MLRFLYALVAVLLLMTIHSFFACQKEKSVLPEQESLNASERTSEGSVNCPLIKSAIKNVNGQLVFADRQQFENCIQCLEQEVEAYNDAYENSYPNASAEQLDSLDEVNNFNEWQPLINFELEKGFTSLRSVVYSQSEQWLLAQNASTINFDNDPDELCPIMDEEERALFNVSGTVKIGSEIVTISQYGDQEMAVPDCCAWLRKKTTTFDANNDPYLFNRQIRAKIKVKSGIVVSKLKAKIKHYKKNSSGNYKKKRAPMRMVIAGGGMIPSVCTPGSQVWSNFVGYKKRKTRKVVARIWSLWREAMVCPANPFFPVSKCSTAFFVDNDSHAYGLTLTK